MTDLERLIQLARKGEGAKEQDFRWSDLKNIDLQGANLSGIDFSNANLSHANLAGTDLSGANLSGTNLTRANLVKANLADTNLFGAILIGANLTHALMGGKKGNVDVSKAILNETIMTIPVYNYEKIEDFGIQIGRYEGEIAERKLNGHGTLKYDNGNIYTGNWINDKQNGFGEMKYQNGDYYRGNWKDGKYDGDGELSITIDEDSWSIYEGGFKENLYHGKGKFKIIDMSRSALGEIYIHEGKWYNGKQSGYGKLIESDASSYEGNWENDQFNGEGTYTWTNKEEDYKTDYCQYKGNWKDGERYGFGRMEYVNGDIYEGNWEEGKRHGAGTIIFSNGDRYSGEWENDIRNGKGIYILSNGKRFEGLYKRGKRNGFGKLIYTNGTVKQGYWRNGDFIGETPMSDKSETIDIPDSITNPKLFFFLDTETTGTPRSWKAPVTDLENWPRLVQLAFVCYNQKGEKLTQGNYIIKPEGFNIPEEATKVHGISTDKANREGKELVKILKLMNKHITNASYIIAHNIEFDEMILGAEFLRMGMINVLEGKTKICTMKQSTQYCAIGSPDSYKFPKLSELYLKLFNKPLSNTHNAEVDVNATAACFWKLTDLRVIKF